MSVIPNRFLFRFKYDCPRVATMPLDEEDRLLELPESARLDPVAGLDGAPRFADVRLGWNDAGLGLSVEVKGKDQQPLGDPDRPRQSDGATLWIDTRADRSGHRASKTCHQFHFLAAGGGSERDEPLFLQTKIHRALQDAPLVSSADVPFRVERTKHGYRIEAFLSANALHGWDPEQYARLGIYYAIRDCELGEQTPGVGSEFPFAEDPSLWQSLDLIKTD
jgi:hypothetical protein